jgi:hypothetical protein
VRVSCFAISAACALFVSVAPRFASAHPLWHGRRLSARVEGPVVESPSALVIEDELVVIRCRTEGALLRCALDATLRVRNDTDRPQSERWVFYGARATAFSLGSAREAGVSVAQGDERDLDRALRRAEGFSPDEVGWAAWEQGFPRLQRSRVGIDLLPGERTTVRVRAELAPSRRFEAPVAQFDGITARHPLLSPRRPLNVFDIDWLCSWSADGPPVERARFDVALPDGWRVELSAVAPGRDAGDPLDLQMISAPSGRASIASVDPRALRAARVALTFIGPAAVFRRGGPVLSAGFTIDRGTPRALVRAGYEFGLGRFALWETSVESNWADSVTLSTVIQLSSPWVVSLPWLLPASIGAGFAWRLPTLEPALRLQAGLQFLGVGLVAHGDIVGERGPLREWGLAVRGSL